MRRFALIVTVLATMILGITHGGVLNGQTPTPGGVPSVNSVAPTTGLAAGGTQVTVTGSNFVTGDQVCFGPNLAPPQTTVIISATQISTVSPPGSGAVTVFVVPPGGAGAGPSNAQFTYTGTPGSPTTPSSVCGSAAGGAVTATFVVDPAGSDLNPCTAAAPCATIQAAVNRTRDRDGVIVNPGVYDISQPIEVPDIIGISSASFATSTTCSPQTLGGFSKVVLRSVTGQPIFHVTGNGSPLVGPLISGFILGGTTSFTNPGAIQLDGSSYAEVRCNIIGQEDLPNAIGVLLRNSDEANIHDNIIHGSTQFPISPTLGPTPPVGGFGIVTAECLGGGRSDDATIARNLLSFNSNAGILLCSDGSGGHQVINNTVRSNGRGIVLRDANDTTVQGNVVQDNYYDGIEVLATSENNIIQQNTIESQEGPNSTGILLQGDGFLFPLDTVITGNFLRRNTINLFIAGARKTLIGVNRSIGVFTGAGTNQPGVITLSGTGNVMSATGERADIVFALGNPTGQSLNSASPSFGQPTDTVINGNTILANGPCGATRGCAIRLLPGVTTNIDATGNDFGVTRPEEIRAEIWDKYHDSALGQVLTPNPGGPVPATPTPVPTLPPTPPPAANAAVPPSLGTPTISGGPVVSPIATATPGASGTGLAASATPAAGAPPAVPPPTAFIDPATGNYFIQLTLCVTSANGQPVVNDQLAVAIFDQAGNALGVVTVATTAQGCFIGAVQAPGAAAAVQPASITIADASGATTTLPVTPGSPIYQTPSSAPVSR